MSRHTMLILLGILSMASPFTGLPFAWLTWFYLFIGLVTAGIGISFALERRQPVSRGASVHESVTVTS